MEITLEKVDQVRERTGVSYAKAKETLEHTKGDVLDAIILLEDEMKNENSSNDKVLVDVPVNAGIAAGIISIIIPPILAFVVVAAVVTQVTIEITKSDGNVEVVNKYITKTVNDVKEKASDLTEKVKEKFEDINVDIGSSTSKNKDTDLGENTFTYTVKFEDIDDKKE